MPKLAIYVPKQDMREIERWRKKLNFSQIFMTALRREIQERSRTMEVSGGQLSRAAEFYRKSLEEDSGCLLDAGYQLGVSSVLGCRLTVPSIRSVLMLDAGMPLSAADVEVVCRALGDADALNRLAQEHGVQSATDPTWRELICRGFAKGVADTWEKVCERMHHEPD
jgi:hypothetical protein